MSINERIKNRRIALDMSQDELANKIGYAGRDSVSRIESGKHSVPQSKLVAIANALNCSVNYLLGIDENENQISQDYNLNLSVAQKQLISMMDNMPSSEQIKLLRIAEIVFDNENKKWLPWVIIGVVMEFAVYLMPANIVIGDNILRSINDWLNGELPVPFVTYDYNSAKEYLLSGHGVMFVTYNDGTSEILEYN